MNNQFLIMHENTKNSVLVCVQHSAVFCVTKATATAFSDQLLRIFHCVDTTDPVLGLEIASQIC